MNLRLALRMMARNRGFAAVIIATMALGIGANTTMFGIIRAVLLRPLPFPEPDRIVTVWESDPATSVVERRLSPANFVDWRAQTSTLEAMGALPNWTGTPWLFNLTGSVGTDQVNGVYASSGMFQVLGVKPLLGQTLSDEDDQRTLSHHVILSYDLWQRRYSGDPAIVGKVIGLDTFNGGSFTVKGVMPRDFNFPPGAKLWVSLADWGGHAMPPPGAADRCCAWFTTFARLKPGVSIEQAQAELTTIARSTAARYSKSPRVKEVRVRPLHDQLVQNHRLALLALFGAVACVLLIACANVANLLLSRAVGRAQEMATRTALGATRLDIARQLFTESLILCVAGAAAGVLVALWAGDVLIRLLGDRVPLLNTTRLDWSVIGFTALVTVVCALVCGLAPLIQWKPLDWRSRGRSETGSTRQLRNSLVAAQVALSVVLASGAGLLLRTVFNLSEADFGIERSNVLAVSADFDVAGLRERGASVRYLDNLLPRLTALPGVRAVAAANPLPLEQNRLSAITREFAPIRTDAESPQVSSAAVTPGYFACMGITLKQGRLIQDDDTRNSKMVAVLSEMAARRYWPGENPIGKRFAIGSLERIGGVSTPNRGTKIEWREVVGVVADVRPAGMQSAALSQIYYSYRQYPLYDTTVLIRTQRDPRGIAQAVRGELVGLDRRVIIKQIRTIDQLVADVISEPRMRAWLMSLFAGIAVLMGAMGIYAVAAYTVNQRTREIGIRMALGARGVDVARMILLQSSRVVAFGIILGIGGALATGRVLTSFLFGVSALDPVTLVGACLLLMVAAIGATYLPARRSMLVDPAVALRSE